MNISTVKKIVFAIGMASSLALSIGAPVFAVDAPTETTLNKALLGGTSETKTLLLNLVSSYSDIQQPGQIVYGITTIVLGFLGIICVVMMMYGGFLWVTAAGEEDKAKKGTTILFQAFIGALIVMAAYTVTYFVLVQLSQVVTK